MAFKSTIDIFRRQEAANASTVAATEARRKEFAQVRGQTRYAASAGELTTLGEKEGITGRSTKRRAASRALLG